MSMIIQLISKYISLSKKQDYVSLSEVVEELYKIKKEMISSPK